MSFDSESASESISQEALRFKLLILYGVHPGEEVVAWADKMIDALNSPPVELLQLSTISPEKTADTLSILEQLSNGANFWTAFESVLPWLRRHLLTRPDDAERIANALYLSVCGFGRSEVSRKYDFAFTFDDEFSLAREGVYGDPAEVLRRFLEELGKFE